MPGITDSEAVIRSQNKIKDGVAAWNALPPTQPQNRANWILIFELALNQVHTKLRNADSGDPEDADVPECPVT